MLPSVGLIVAYTLSPTLKVIGDNLIANCKISPHLSEPHSDVHATRDISDVPCSELINGIDDISKDEKTKHPEKAQSAN